MTDLNELERLLAEATKTPWAVASKNPTFGYWHVRQDPENWDGKGYQAVCTIPADHKNTYYGEMFRANAHLIVAAVNALPALIAEMRELRAEKERLDWLEDNPDVYFMRYSRPNMPVVLLTTDHDFMCDPEFAQGDTIRAAIDAAKGGSDAPKD